MENFPNEPNPGMITFYIQLFEKMISFKVEEKEITEARTALSKVLENPKSTTKEIAVYMIQYDDLTEQKIEEVNITDRTLPRLVHMLEKALLYYKSKRYNDFQDELQDLIILIENEILYPKNNVEIIKTLQELLNLLESLI